MAVGAPRHVLGPSPRHEKGEHDVEPSDAHEHEPSPVLEARGVTKRFATGRGSRFDALTAVSLQLWRGETLAIVGESGSGKTTLANVLLGLLRPDEGSVFLDRVAWARLSHREARPHRHKLQLVSQDPFASLNPRRKVGLSVAEPMRAQGHRTKGEAMERARELLAEVGLGAESVDKYPHQFSGGQRQRISIARALCVQPMAIVLDEPTSALDVSVQADILDLLARLQHQHQTSYIFITHNLAVAEQISTRVVVMWAGRIVEAGSRRDVYERPSHPYTQRLFDAAPTGDVTRRRRSGARAAETAPAEAPRLPTGPAELVEVSPGHFVAVG